MGTLDGLREAVLASTEWQPPFSDNELMSIAKDVEGNRKVTASAMGQVAVAEWRDMRHRVMLAIDAYEREHPGLEDWTIKCCRCGKPGRPHDPRWLYDQALIERPIPLEKAHVCPDCERVGDIRDD